MGKDKGQTVTVGIVDSLQGDTWNGEVEQTPQNLGPKF